MMGERRVMQEALFYGFSLERHVPDNHLLRRIDRFVDLSEVRTHLEPYYSETGRPSIDPELMIRMLIVGYSFGIRSERRLCDEVHLNLAYRWFCRLGLGVKRALFNETATPGDGARDGRLLLCIDQTNVQLAGSNESGSARAVPRLCRGRSACPHRLQRQSGGQSLVADGRGRPPKSSPATTWTTILTIPSATHRTTPGAAAGANPCRQLILPTTNSPH